MTVEDRCTDPALVISYLTLRRIVGLLGISFPFVLFVGALLLFGTGMQGSMSAYYHTGMRDVFVGTLWVIGFFLLSYKGWGHDNIIGNLACMFAVGTAVFPTRPEGAVSRGSAVAGYLHLAFAALFFLTLIYFSFFLFTKTDPRRKPTRRKLQRNVVYRCCGGVMSCCILLIVVYSSVLPGSAVRVLEPLRPVFWLESLAVVAFGLSWLTKGEAILRDEAPPGG